MENSSIPLFIKHVGNTVGIAHVNECIPTTINNETSSEFQNDKSRVDLVDPLLVRDPNSLFCTKMSHIMNRNYFSIICLMKMN